jgi:hypothetical protein
VPRYRAFTSALWYLKALTQRLSLEYTQSVLYLRTHHQYHLPIPLFLFGGPLETSSSHRLRALGKLPMSSWSAGVCSAGKVRLGSGSGPSL